MCDYSACLGIPNAFGLFMDLAGEHAELLGLGREAMAQKNLFWLAVRTRVQFAAPRPAMLRPVTAATWPARPEKLRCERYYTLSSEGVPVAEGKTEWAAIDTKTGRLCKVFDIYPPELAMADEIVCPEPFARITGDFSGLPPAGQYRVSSSDIDYGGHMNNVTYVRALLGTFGVQELTSLRVSRLELNYRSPCYEGELLSIRRRPFEGGLDLAMLRPDGTPAVLARMLCQTDG